MIGQESLPMRSLLVIALLLPFGFSTKPAAAESFCDPGLPQNSTAATAYRMRPGRCEGIFAQQVSSPHLEIRSLVGTVQAFDPKRDSELALIWKAPPGDKADILLRAFSFKPGTYYRMDTRVSPDRSTYRWPTDVLDSVGLGRADLGLLAWTEGLEPDGTKNTVYLPLSTGTGSSQARKGYTVTFVPSTRLSEVHVKVSRLEGQKAPTVLRDEKLVDEYYALGEPAEFSTGTLGAAGFYRITLTAHPKAGSIVQNFDLYHPGD